RLLPRAAPALELRAHRPARRRRARDHARRRTGRRPGDRGRRRARQSARCRCRARRRAHRVRVDRPTARTGSPQAIAPRRSSRTTRESTRLPTPEQDPPPTPACGAASARTDHWLGVRAHMTRYVLVPGAGGSAWYWHRVVGELTQRGHEVVAVELPGADPLPGWRSTAI